MRTIVYCRKSTDRDDMQMQSLDTQLNWCLDYCKEQKLNIVETILESKSAKQPGREGFNKMVMMFAKGEIDTIVTLHLDRLTRNAVDEGTLKRYAQNKKIKEIHCKEGVFTGDQVLMLSIHFGFSNQYIIDLRKKVIEGINTKVKSGGIVSKAPLGYVNNKETRGADIDENSYCYIKRIFEMRSKGCSYDLITETVLKEGLRSKKGNVVARSIIERTIKNPFYYGILEYAGEFYEGKHKAIISKRLWDKANKFGRGITYIKDKKLTPLKGKVVHGETGVIMCSSLIKKKYIYFHIHSRRGKLWYNQSKIIQAFDQNIRLYSIPDQYKDDVKRGLAHFHTNMVKYNKKQRTVLNGKASKLENEKTSLIKMRSSGEISSQEFIDMKNTLMDDIAQIKDQIIKLDNDDSKILDNFDNMVELLVDLVTKRKTKTIEQKVLIINFIVVELRITDKKGLQIEENLFFKALQKVNSNKWWVI